MGRKDAAGKPGHCVTVVSESHFAGVAGYEDTLGGGFQLAHVLAHRRLGKPKPFCGLGETQGLCDSQKGAELDGIEHGTPLSAGQRRAGVSRRFPWHCKPLIAFRNASYRRNTLP